MTVALNTYGGAMGSISKADFERAAKRVCHVELTPVQLDIMYHVFDLDGDGTLDAEEVRHERCEKLRIGRSRVLRLRERSIRRWLWWSAERSGADRQKIGWLQFRAGTD